MKNANKTLTRLAGSLFGRESRMENVASFSFPLAQKQQSSSRRITLSTIALLSIALIPSWMFGATFFSQRNLASDIPLLADYTDPNLVNPWGLALAPFWICNNRTGTYTVSGVDGTPTATVTNVSPAPGKTGVGKCTGAVRNNNTAAFLVAPGTTGTWLLNTEDGTITIRSGGQNIVKVDNSKTGAVYKGIALSNNPDYVYNANFNSGKIDVYDGTWTAAALAGTFADPQVPAGFAPFNIQNIAGKLYVAYAKQDAAKQNDLRGAGNGYVAVFDLNGNLIQHLVSGGKLNSPWGMAIAPASWGDFAGALLVGNFGDGAINAYNATTGAAIGTIQYPNGNPVTNTGLWALMFGTGGNGGDVNKLYLTAGISGNSGIQSHGLFAAISVTTATSATPAVKDGGLVNAASYGDVAPGAIASLFGTNLTDGTSCLPPTCGPTVDNLGRLRTNMAGAQVSINNTPVPVLFATPQQLAVQIPTDISGTSADIQVSVNGQTSAPSTFSVQPFSPGLFSINSQGTGAGVVTHANGSLVNAAAPARPSEVLILYATGLGQVTPFLPTGVIPQGIVKTLTTPVVLVDNLTAAVQFSGVAGCCAGLNQINFVVPANVRIGSDIAVALTGAGKQSNTVTIVTAP